MEFKLPEIGEGVYEAELVSWLVKPGDDVTRGQNLMEVLTDKATMEVPAPFAGTIQKLHAEPGQQIKVGDVVLSYETKGEAKKPAQDRVEKAVTKAPSRRAVPVGKAVNGPSRRSDLPVKAAPSVRLMARKLGIDLASVAGSGPEGRILVEDLSRQMQTPGREPPASVSEPRPDYATPGQRIKLQGLRRKIAEHMVLAKHTIPHYSYVDECDVSDLVRIRQGLREPYQRAGVHITYLPFLVKAVVAALKEVPIVNASLDDKSGEIVLHDRYHIGVAVATPAGLIVPVIHDADKKDLLDIAREVDRLTSAARTGKIRREDLLDGTFTITSIGNIGGLFATPIIPHPQVGILGVGKIVKRPVFDGAGQVRGADMVYLSFSFDHRVLDGAVGAVFGNAVIQRLQNPLALLLSEPSVRG
jgi:pyruvate dehydrogenase E2 component (dihydrolipoamide acetyltransferase)/2-oxoisovalerate dehydrogenase E2 component (dihydrolipoyl transacylase)